MKKIFKSIGKYCLSFLTWLLIGILMGIICGFVGVAFHVFIFWGSGLRITHAWILYLLPAAGLLIAVIYKLAKDELTTDQVIGSINSSGPVSPLMAPLIFVSAVISHTVGASVGREGAAIQLGGSLGYNAGKLLKFKTRDRKILTKCGISAVFSALFQAPLGAAIFAMEVSSVGTFYYSDLIPCLASAITANTLARLLGAAKEIPALSVVPEISFKSIGLVLLLAILVGGLTILFCLGLKKGEKLFEKLLPNSLIRGAAGGAAILLATLVLGNQNFNGSGIGLIRMAMEGNTQWWFFLVKMAFTIVSVGCCFKGGEIVPSLSIGAMFGCFFSQISGMDPAFGAAVGMVAMLCGMVNCPVASIFLGLELFGFEGAVYFAAASAVSYLFSGNFGLYGKQKIIYSRIRR